MSKVVPAGHQCALTLVMCDSEGKNGFTVIYSGEKVMPHIDVQFYLPSGSRENTWLSHSLLKFPNIFPKGTTKFKYSLLKQHT